MRTRPSLSPVIYPSLFAGRGWLGPSLRTLATVSFRPASLHMCVCVSELVCLCDGIPWQSRNAKSALPFSFSPQPPLTLSLSLSLSFSLRWTAIVLQRSPLEPCAKCQVQMAKFFKWNDAGCRELETGVCRRKCNWNCCPTSAALYDLWICCQFAIVALTV